MVIEKLNKVRSPEEKIESGRYLNKGLIEFIAAKLSYVARDAVFHCWIYLIQKFCWKDLQPK